MKLDRSHIPQTPGVYLFRDRSGAVIYVGKAVNLKKRVLQYFQRDDRSRAQISLLIPHIATIDTTKTVSEFDALLLEASLIRNYKPKYNAISKDDKSPLYVVLTLSEEFPNVLFRRGRVLDLFRKHDAIFGPFQSARVARSLMRDIRRGIPYCTQIRRSGSPCFYTHIGLCAPCPSYISKLPLGAERNTLKNQYRANIFRLRDILSGRSTNVIRALGMEMKRAALRDDFEVAAFIKKQIDALYSLYTRHFDISMYETSSDALSQMGKNNTSALKDILSKYISIGTLNRIECVDISNLAGTQATGSFVVALGGIPDPSQYKRFRIRGPNTPNDVGMMEEVLRRRFAHPEWGKPDLLVVDGGKSQLARAVAILKRNDLPTPVIGLAKRLEEIVLVHDNRFRIVRLPLTSPALHLLQRIRDEAHRFAITYHKKLRKTHAFATMRST